MCRDVWASIYCFDTIYKVVSHNSCYNGLHALLDTQTVVCEHRRICRAACLKKHNYT